MLGALAFVAAGQEDGGPPILVDIVGGEPGECDGGPLSPAEIVMLSLIGLVGCLAIPLVVMACLLPLFALGLVGSRRRGSGVGMLTFVDHPEK